MDRLRELAVCELAKTLTCQTEAWPEFGLSCTSGSSLSAPLNTSGVLASTRLELVSRGDRQAAVS